MVEADTKVAFNLLLDKHTDMQGMREIDDMEAEEINLVLCSLQTDWLFPVLYGSMFNVSIHDLGKPLIILHKLEAVTFHFQTTLC